MEEANDDISERDVATYHFTPVQPHHNDCVWACRERAVAESLYSLFREHVLCTSWCASLDATPWAGHEGGSVERIEIFFGGVLRFYDGRHR
jgi:hypothetical protein